MLCLFCLCGSKSSKNLQVFYVEKLATRINFKQQYMLGFWYKQNPSKHTPKCLLFVTILYDRNPDKSFIVPVYLNKVNHFLKNCLINYLT